MISSSKPRKQRIFRFTAPMHVRQKFVHARIAKELAAKLGISKRNIAVRKGDTVKVMSGSHKGKTGKVTTVDLKRTIVIIDGISRKNAKGKELPIPIKTSSVYVTDLDLSDKLRTAKIEAAKAKKV
ncbi:50S ribosomal protein L24 [uncultured archaeon]|nr:50S ribosomal protein L24 [uncultured archaeon]